MISLSPRFVLLATLISSTLAHLVPQNLHRRQIDLPEGFKAVDVAPADEKITFRIALAQGDFAGLEKALYDAATPGSPQYGQYLTKDQVKQYAAPTTDAVAAVTAWLSSHGLSPTSLTASGDLISVEATVAQANELLKAEYTTFEREGSESSVTRTLSYALPQDVQQHVVAIHPTVAFPLSERASQELISSWTEGRNTAATGDATDEQNISARQAEEDEVPESCIPESGNSTWQNSIKPRALPCRLDLYQVPRVPLGEPSSGTGVWVSAFNNLPAHRNRTMLNIEYWRPELAGREPFKSVLITGGVNNQLPFGNLIPGTTEMASIMGASPNTPATYMSVGIDNADGSDFMVWFLDQAEYLLSLDSPPEILVFRFAQKESTIDPDLARHLCNLYAQLAARGVTLIYAVGGNGVDSCTKFDVTFPATCPYVTSVGGAEINVGQRREIPFFGNNGGFSSLFSRPKWQKRAVSAYLKTIPEGLHEGLYNPSGRATPDVSVIDWDVSVEMDKGSSRSQTMLQASNFAGIIAVLNEELARAGKPKLGFLNPFLYKNAGAFHDFTTGTLTGCTGKGFNATEGWDAMSGLGSPRYQRLRAAAGL